MELTMDQLLAISKEVSKGGELENILPNGYSEADIAVVKGKDIFTRNIYLKDAFFSEWEARKDMKNSSSFSESDLPDNCWVELVSV